ncbi:PIN-domain RNase, VapC-type toxin [Ferroplasma acidiphilum]|uniref:PIN-domain RNase, VapC-type toxin n=1 Tax=Ferroplasma acidiphilum TaxID=74969 RepID=A0A1V0N409_9ARCH|nr:type II toxin-antitoxin system VapC family toxin [Ferroplasma acidiphilum]ARD84841.1 PIN-domain RNase, VapC-type toxin [Ferroplasma acidiphilum]
MKGNIDYTFVVDTSSLFNLFFIDSKNIVLEIMHKSFILDLTFYELGSVFVKGNDNHIKNLNKTEITELINNIEKLISGINVIRIQPEHISGIMHISFSTGLTFYDSSYVFYSKNLNLPLLTDDKEINSKAKKLGINVMKVDDL